MISFRPILRNPATWLLVAVLAWSPAGAGDANLEEAVRLYEAGSYAQALPLLEAIVATGDADGITLYRLYFCQRSVGAPGQQESLNTARALLEKEVAEAEGFETAFYLSSVYANLSLADEFARVSAETTARFEAGEIDKPTTAEEQFRLGKLYADQDRDADAAPWFRLAVEGFVASPETRRRLYLEWAARWLGERALDGERFEVAAQQYEHVVAAGQPTIQDLDKLALACLMIGRFTDAKEAWNAATRLNPADADRYRYGAGLAQLAAGVEEVPISPDGERSWDEVSQQELDQVLVQQSQKVRETRAEIEAAGTLTKETRKAFGARLAEARPLFVAAALEYFRRGLSLREAAFFGGYAPLIFHPREWQVDTDGGGRKWTAQEVAEERERRKREAESKKKSKKSD